MIMRKHTLAILIILLLALLPALCLGEGYNSNPVSGGGWTDDGETVSTDRAVSMGTSRLVPVSVAELPATGVKGTTYQVDDAADAADCTLGGGTVTTECFWTGSAYVSRFSGGVGPTGSSAYELAVANGFEGTVAQWLASLESTVPGPATVWWSGFNTPAAAGVTGADGDYFFDTSQEAKIFKRIAGVWTQQNAIRGPAGVSTYVYIAYASSNTGTGFSLTPSDSLKYRAEIRSATEIASPDADDFSAATWVKFAGDDGDDGAPGAPGTNGLGFVDAEDGEYRLDLPQNTIPITFTLPSGFGSLFFAADGTLMQWRPGEAAPEVFGTGLGLPEGGTVGQIIVKTEDGAEWQDFEDQSAYVTLLAAFNAAGLNSFTFAPETPASYPYWSQSGTFNLDFTITDSSSTYTIAGVRYDIGSGYEGNSLSDQGSDVWRVALADLTEGSYTLQLEVADSKGVPNTGESLEFTVGVDTTDPVVDAGVDQDHDGTGEEITVSGISITEANEASRERQIYNTTDSAVTAAYASFSGTSVAYTLPADTDDYRFDIRVTDLAGRQHVDSVAVPYAASGVTPGFIGLYAADPTGTTNVSDVDSQANGFGSPFVTVTPGSVNRICAAINADDGTLNAAIYSSDRATKHVDGTAVAVSVAGWNCTMLDAPFVLVADTTYYLIGGRNTWTQYYNSEGSGTAYRSITIGASLTDTMPATATGGTVDAATTVYIYADYVE